MRHPKLPSGQVIEVAAISVPHFRAAGWLLVDEAPAVAAATPSALDAPPAVDDGDTPTPVALKRRRTQKED